MFHQLFRRDVKFLDDIGSQLVFEVGTSVISAGSFVTIKVRGVRLPNDSVVTLRSN
jgi:hypothetical protein